MGEAQNYDLFENVGATTGPDENFCRIKKLIADYERKKKAHQDYGPHPELKAPIEGSGVPVFRIKVSYCHRNKIGPEGALSSL